MRRNGWNPLVIGVLAILGAGLSTWLFYTDVVTGAIKPCPTGGGCETVATSRYAWMGGIHVTMIGLAGYLLLGILAALWWGGQPHARRLLLVASSGGLLFTIYLQYISLAVLRATCFWCLLSASMITVIWLMIVSSCGLRAAAK